MRCNEWWVDSISITPDWAAVFKEAFFIWENDNLNYIVEWAENIKHMYMSLLLNVMEINLGHYYKHFLLVFCHTVDMIYQLGITEIISPSIVCSSELYVWTYLDVQVYTLH